VVLSTVEPPEPPGERLDNAVSRRIRDGVQADRGGMNDCAIIALEPWQQAFVHQATEEFVLGLIHSDGCRVVANDRGVLPFRSIRYHFSNRSEDIIGLFTAALDKLGIHWTRST
jgi:hypothetical protein